MAPPKLKPVEVYYPESDGQPMAETDIHRDLMVDLIASVDWHFREDRDFYVSGNLFIYFEEGNPEKAVAPDFFVVHGVPKGQRRTFKVWEEKKGPELVIELTSRKTQVEDRGNKRAIYEELGVREYFIFDPERSSLRPVVTGFQLEDEFFQAMPPLRTKGNRIVFRSEVLGLELHAFAQMLRWVDPGTGKPLPIPREAYQLAEERLQRAERAETEVARLREELARLRRKSPR